MANEADKASLDKILSERHCLRGLLLMMTGLELGGTLSSCQAVRLNCTENRLYHDACINEVFTRDSRNCYSVS